MTSALGAAGEVAIASLVERAPLASSLAQGFAAQGFRLALVGGPVRDALLGRLGNDLDFSTNAKPEDWVLEQAGNRVQIIKKDENGKGILQFGTEIVSSADCSLAALLGASPGASTAVSIMIELIERCFGEQINSAD